MFLLSPRAAIAPWLAGTATEGARITKAGRKALSQYLETMGRLVEQASTPRK